jgi:hypothetical protein
MVGELLTNAPTVRQRAKSLPTTKINVRLTIRYCDIPFVKANACTHDGDYFLFNWVYLLFGGRIGTYLIDT